MKTIATAILLTCLSPVLSAADGAKIGQTLPKLSQLLPKATIPNTSGKVLLVDFWASWCAPCKQSFPALNQLQTKYGSKGLVILGIGVDEDAAKYKAFAESMKVSFSIAPDTDHQAATFFNPASMPSSYLVDRKGVIRYVHSGFRGEKTVAEYTTEIEALLAEK